MSLPKLVFSGTGDSVNAFFNPNAGPDGSVDQMWDGSSWAQTSEGTHPIFLSSAAYVPAQKRCYFFGNTDAGQDATYYDVATNTWTSLTSIPTTPACFGQGAAALLGTVIYCMGGLTAANTGGGTTQVFSWDTTQGPSGSYVTTYNALPEKTQSCVAVTVGSLIYHGGGEDGDGGGVPTAHWYRWNPLTDTRTALTSMPAPVYGAACFYLNGFIYLVGGASTGETNYAGSTRVQRYSIASDTWTSAASMAAYPLSVNRACACVLNGTPIVAGGWNASGFALDGTNAQGGVYKYNAGADSWSSHSTLFNSVVGSLLAPIDVTLLPHIGDSAPVMRR